MMMNKLAGIALGMCLVGGCVDDDGEIKPDQSDVKGGVDGKAEAWGSADNPALFNANLEYRDDRAPDDGRGDQHPVGRQLLAGLRGQHQQQVGGRELEPRRRRSTARRSA